jgi:signal transduction histidine kinase
MKNSVIGKNFYEVMDGGVNVPELRTKLDNLIKANDFLTDFQVDHQHRRGDLRLLTVKARRIYQPPNLLFMLLFSDQVETEKLLKEKEAVISIAAHEVKTPISVIKAYSQILKRELKVASPITTQALDKINEHISNLSNLVSSLMDTSKMTPGDMRLDNEVFNLCELVSDTIEGFDLTVNTHHISISGTADCIVQADKMRIGTVITNLLSNAVKYSPNADKVIVNLEANDGFAKVSVQDFGIGIPERERDIIFEQFARTETAKKSNIPGHGIGLNLASKIVRLQGGEIGFITKEGEGSTFYFTLPLY